MSYKIGLFLKVFLFKKIEKQSLIHYYNFVG